MIRKINSPQGLIALSLFLGTFCAFEAVSINKARQQTKTGSSSSEKKDTKNEDIKKNILDLLQEEQEAISNAMETKNRVHQNIYAEVKKNAGKMTDEEVAEMKSFLQKKFAEIKDFEEYSRKNQAALHRFESLSLSRVDPSEPVDRRAKTSMGASKSWGPSRAAASSEDDLAGLSDEASEKWDPRAKTSMGASKSWGPSGAAASAEDGLVSLSDEASEKWGPRAKTSMGASKSWGPSGAAASAEDGLVSLSDEASENWGFQAKPYMGAGSLSGWGSRPIAGSLSGLRSLPDASRVRSSGPSGAAASATTADQRSLRNETSKGVARTTSTAAEQDSLGKKALDLDLDLDLD